MRERGISLPYKMQFDDHPDDAGRLIGSDEGVSLDDWWHRRSYAEYLTRSLTCSDNPMNTDYMLRMGPHFTLDHAYQAGVVQF